MRQPVIDEMIAFLEKENPEGIQRIRNSNPTFTDILKVGSILGEQEYDSNELKTRASVCFAATEQAIILCEKILPSMKAKLAGSQKLQLYGQIVTTISGASVITSLAANYPTITYISGAFSLLGALVPLFIEYQRKTLYKNKQLDEMYTELIKLRLDAESNAKELQFFIDHNFNVEGITEILNKCNQLCLNISELRLAFNG